MAKLSRLRLLFDNSFKLWNDRNIKALVKNIELLTKENQDKLNSFVEARGKSLIPRMREFIKCGLYRQTFLDSVALFVAGIFNKI